jgi:Proprotein convertase P-domain
MAKSYVNYLPALQTSLSTLTVPATGTVPNTANGAALPFDMSNTPFNKIESVQVGVNIAQAPVSNAPPNVYPSGLWCNQIELTSPSGTKSILMHAFQGTGDYDAVNQVTYPQSALVDVMFLSNAFYGEPAKGSWILKVLDLCTGATSGTTIASGSQQLLILNGH